MEALILGGIAALTLLVGVPIAYVILLVCFLILAGSSTQ